MKQTLQNEGCYEKTEIFGKPTVSAGMVSMENKELNPKLLNLVNIAKSKRQEDVLNVIRHNHFHAGYDTNSKFCVLNDEVKDKLEMNFETQMKILVKSEEDVEVRENLKEYCKHARNHPDFDEEKLVDDILARNFSFL